MNDEKEDMVKIVIAFMNELYIYECGLIVKIDNGSMNHVCIDD